VTDIGSVPDTGSGSPADTTTPVEPTTAVDAGLGGSADQPVGRFSHRTTVFLIAAGAVILLLVGATAGLALSGRFGGSDTAATPTTESVDAGFARDMAVHHDQGVLMAHYAEQNTTDPEIEVMAYDIGYTQTDQLGQMQGWLSLWDLPDSGTAPRMAWMGATAADHGMAMGSAAATSGALSAGSGAAGSGATGSGATGSGAPAFDTPLMPGMATDSEIAKLKDLKGTESDIYFLQLMIRHHQGGAAMMQYAAEHAALPVVRNFADKMVQAQTAEISVMTQMLSERGAEPLPAPTG
jgi:uncharacterized protein (DUF305 family)